MKIDLNAIRAQAEEEINSRRGEGEGSGNQYPVVYPGENGKLTVRLLYNVKANVVQRKIVRHGKVACMSVYGESCPVCDAIAQVKEMKGDDSGVSRKYGYKVRGVCYAQIVDHEATYFRGENDPKKGDVITFMYPLTVFKGISDKIFESGDNLNKLISENDGLPIVVKRAQEGKGFPSYSVEVFPYGSSKMFKDDDEKTGEEKFDDLLNSLPNLYDAFIPNLPNDEVRKENKALAETIIQEYLSGNTVNPGDSDTSAPTPKEEEDKKAESFKEAVSNPAPTQEPSSDSSGRPECFGNHKDGDKKCMLCPLEPECYDA